MRLTRYLRPAQIRLELETAAPADLPEGWTPERLAWSVKERVLGEIVRLFAASGKIGNVRKFGVDLLNRERKSSTAIGGGIAIPHVRTMQAREFIFCFARSTPGVEFGAPDGAPVHFFFGVVAPPHDDRLYLEVYKEIAVAFGSDETKEALRAAGDEHEVIRVLSAFGE
jgi:mannitol/fructose-specific phosphotransferase system IIA component (Ntr-type)